MSPSANNNPTSEDAKSEARRQQQQIQKLESDIRTGERWIICLTGAMAFFSLCSVAVSLMQWCAYRDQLGVMQKTLREMISNNATTTNQLWQAIGNLNWQAKTTEDALSLSREQFRSDERPYIWVTNNGMGSPNVAYPPKFPDLGQVLWTVHYTNYGKTPAYKLTTEKTISVGSWPLEQSYRGDSPIQGPEFLPVYDLNASVTAGLPAR